MDPQWRRPVETNSAIDVVNSEVATIRSMYNSPATAARNRADASSADRVVAVRLAGLVIAAKAVRVIISGQFFGESILGVITGATVYISGAALCRTVDLAASLPASDVVGLFVILLVAVVLGKDVVIAGAKMGIQTFFVFNAASKP